MITSSTPDNWPNLQSEVGRILEECGFKVEVEKTIQTVRGDVELDVYAEEEVRGRRYTIICECKLWKSRVPQNVIHAFRTVVADIGANIGYIVSSNGFQQGALNASELTNVKLATWQEFQDAFEESWYEEFLSPTIAEKLDPLLSYAEPFFPKWFPALPEEDKQIFLELKNQYDEFGWLVMSFTPYARWGRDNPYPSLPVIDRLPQDSDLIAKVPKEILEAKGYREFFDAAISFGEDAIKKFRRLRESVT
jgi:restriction system protein